MAPHLVAGECGAHLGEQPLVRLGVQLEEARADDGVEPGVPQELEPLVARQAAAQVRLVQEGQREAAVQHAVAQLLPARGARLLTRSEPQLGANLRSGTRT